MAKDKEGEAEHTPTYVQSENTGSGSPSLALRIRGMRGGERKENASSNGTDVPRMAREIWGKISADWRS